ncbi:putative cytokinetic ring protein SteA [Aeromicrobium sp. CTD01-1L150]|uniref:putative cytokinetic ring protein SteA n=1 Tax=Aeromicrobium sp. CTD01-1L150 TaxID=3341830 RepID=UPI0035C19D57
MSRWKSREPTPQTDDATVSGVAKFARPGDHAAKSLKSGDIAVVDLPDLDRAQAEALVGRGVRAVVNAAASSSGNYPNLGPKVLADAGILLIDKVGAGVFSSMRSGEKVAIRDGKIFRGKTLIAQGTSLDDAAVSASLGEAEQGLSTQLGSLTANAADHLERERAMLLQGERVPQLRDRLRGRHVVVVSQGYEWEADLKKIKRWMREHDPVIIAVTDAADALLARGTTPHVVIGPVDDLSDRAVRSGADIVVTSGSGKATGHERFEKADVDAHTFVAAGLPADLALVLADENDAPVIVQVGQPKGLVQFLERGAAEVASSFVTRLRASSRLVDADAVGHLSGRAVPMWPIFLLLLAGVVALVVAVAATPVGQQWFDSLGERVSDLRTWIEGLIS